MIEAFSAVVPVFLLIGLGVCLDLFRALPENANQTLSLYVLNVALPLLLFQIMATAPLESFAHPQFWLGVIAAQFLIYGACYAADRILARHDSAAATVTALGGCFCNAAFVGIPVITSALPGNAEALFVAGLFTITPNLLFVVGQVQLAAHDPSRSMPQGRKAVLLHVLRYSLLYNAVFWGMAGGVLVSALGLGLWGPLDRAAELVGHTAAPCMLVTLGLTLRERLAVVFRHAGNHALLRQAESMAAVCQWAEGDLQAAAERFGGQSDGAVWRLELDAAGDDTEENASGWVEITLLPEEGLLGRAQVRAESRKDGLVGEFPLAWQREAP